MNYLCKNNWSEKSRNSCHCSRLTLIMTKSSFSIDCYQVFRFYFHYKSCYVHVWGPVCVYGWWWWWWWFGVHAFIFIIIIIIIAHEVKAIIFSQNNWNRGCGLLNKMEDGCSGVHFITMTALLSRQYKQLLSPAKSKSTNPSPNTTPLSALPPHLIDF